MRGAVQTIRFLVTQGAKIHVRGEDGGTPLYWAAHARQEESIRTLKELGCSIEFSILFSLLKRIFQQG